ncbi:hypothetical protein BX281_0076 [Streptomyces sp. Ag82_O1-15]|uniref:hypothetical protein n=1 Tax=Streptomyces sp. Ag82_O1-15 TaxID=1938855 RepID=UPI000BC47301|nr:hypothetical protein [Streptomyces sp. Ag82_O1-15]PBC92426.1 hypothetical protein BX281_0076 [Streptomyces sp. Ag82_O1-15]
MTQVTDQIQPNLRGGRSDTASRTPQAGPAASLTESVTAYIPTEVVAAYVAVIGLLQQPVDHSRVPDWVVFWAFLCISPLAVWLGLARQERSKGLPLPVHPQSWPAHTWFNLIAATASFALWGFSLPETPFQDFGWYKSGYGTGALVIGTLLLGLVSPLFQWDAEARRSLSAAVQPEEA